MTAATSTMRGCADDTSCLQRVAAAVDTTTRSCGRTTIAQGLTQATSAWLCGATTVKSPAARRRRRCMPCAAVRTRCPVCRRRHRHRCRRRRLNCRLHHPPHLRLHHHRRRHRRLLPHPLLLHLLQSPRHRRRRRRRRPLPRISASSSQHALRKSSLGALWVWPSSAAAPSSSRSLHAGCNESTRHCTSGLQSRRQRLSTSTLSCSSS